MVETEPKMFKFYLKMTPLYLTVFPPYWNDGRELCQEGKILQDK